MFSRLKEIVDNNGWQKSAKEVAKEILTEREE